MHLICAGIPNEPQSQPPKKKVLPVTEGLPFESSCSVLSTADNPRFMCAYLTRNVSATKEQLDRLVDSNACLNHDSPCCCDLIEGGCAYCDNAECVQFSGNDTNIIVRSAEDHHDHCSPLQIIKFNSDRALLSDNGRFIVCGYQQDTAVDVEFYSTIQLKVQHNYFFFKILFSVLGGVVLIVAVTGLICVRVCVRRKRSHVSSSKLYYTCVCGCVLATEVAIGQIHLS